MDTNSSSSSSSSSFSYPNLLRATTSDIEEFILLASSQPKKRAGRKKFKETRHPVYRGVRRRNNNKWVCELREPIKQKRIWLGTYPTPEMAARAHDVAAIALRGSLATLNFADSIWRLPVPVSNDPKDIRQAASKAAEAFRHDPELVGVDYMNDEVSSSEEVTNQDLVGGSNGTANDLEAKELKIQNLEIMESILCCNWGDNSEILEIEGSWQENMANGLMFSPSPCLGGRFSWDDVEISDVEVSLWSYCE